MTYEMIRVDHDFPLTIVTIAEQEACNALGERARVELAAAFDALKRDGDQWRAIATAHGDKVFHAGHDLKQQAQGDGFALPTTGFGGLTARPEPRVGLSALAGGMQRLPIQIGLKRAKGMIPTGKSATTEGLALGFVKEVAPLGEVMGRAPAMDR